MMGGEITPIQALSAKLQLLESESGRPVKGKLATFKLADVEFTVLAAAQQLQVWQQRVCQIIERHGSERLVSEAALSDEELTHLFAAATESCAFSFEPRFIVRSDASAVGR